MEALNDGEGKNHGLKWVKYSTIIGNITREVCLQENNRESIKLLKVWNSYTWRKSLIGKLFSFACFLFLSPSCKSLFYLVFILYLLEPKGWDKVARCCILIGGGRWWEKPKIVSMPIVLRCMHLVHFCVH